MYLTKKLEYEVSAALRAAGDVERVAVLANGARLAVPMWHETGRQLYFFGSEKLMSGWLYESETTRFICNWLRPGDTFVDIGANLGYYTLLASQIVGPSGKCHAFEPNERLTGWSDQSVNLNGAKERVVFNRLAVADRTGTVDFYVPLDPQRDPNASMMVESYSRDVHKYQVSSITLDEYVVRHALNDIRLIKIDVEGAEDLVLVGARKVLTEMHPDAVILEHAPEILVDPKAQWERVSGIMESAGYVASLIDSRGGLRPLGTGMPSDSVQNVCFTRA
jgi:FkbM family methyltransferase